MNDSAAPGTVPPARRPAIRRAAHAPTHAVKGAVRGVRGAVFRRPSRAALIKDALLFGALALPVVANLISPLEPASASWWAQVAGLGVLAAAIAVCRAWPAAALLTAIALILVHGNFVFAMPVMSYLAGLRTARHGRCCGGSPRCSSAARCCRPPAAWTSPPGSPRRCGWSCWASCPGWWAATGASTRSSCAPGWERAEHLENQQRIIAERERLRERARIAQDMHDSLGHELALIAVRAGALEVAADLGDRHRAAAAELRTGAADATEHLREIIGVLRDDAPGENPADPGGGTLPAAGPAGERRCRPPARASPSWSPGPAPPASRSPSPPPGPRRATPRTRRPHRHR
ncbi:histidine kinase dimerization/phosphoacceptor domain-containing protein [Actinomadura madurae]|uniref:histidine kinase dimerization/phosphoacceptor domain-containing protein n=1 Tax=Actinomadura madurae TaxID=1993 RepID=UPI0020D22D68|nr:histidine kinase dimerization/phosphoacceptor domain-containing protein [Actinomadura madurae]MCQ0011553.1 histidine kinase dimerization/phosphoacceptor domain-containing protein [Actinomadura madurae]